MTSWKAHPAQPKLNADSLVTGRKLGYGGGTAPRNRYRGVKATEAFRRSAARLGDDVRTFRVIFSPDFPVLRGRELTLRYAPRALITSEVRLGPSSIKGHRKKGVRKHHPARAMF